MQQRLPPVNDHLELPLDHRTASLRTRRIALGLSDAKFAPLLGVSSDQLRQIEANLHDEDLRFLMNLVTSILELELESKRAETSRPRRFARAHLLQPPREQLYV